MKYRVFNEFALFLAFILFGLPASAATITWGVPAITNYYTPSQVSTQGTLIDSFTWSSTNTTVNGVEFKAYAGRSGTVASFSGSQFKIDLGTNTYSQHFANINSQASFVTSYATTLARAGQVNTPVGANITVTGLIPGKVYQVQFWQAPWDNPYPSILSSSPDFTSGSSPQLVSTAARLDGKLVPHFIVGTFTANSSTQIIYFKNPNPGVALSPAAGQIRLLGDSHAEAQVMAIPRFPVVEDSYAPNLCRRIKADGSLMTSVTVTSQSAGTYPWYTNAPANLIDNNSECGFVWRVEAAQRPSFQFTVTLDLGADYLINKILIAWSPHWQRAERWTVSTSTDGVSYSTIEEVFAANSTTADDAFRNLRFPDRMARYVRIVGQGVQSATGTEVALGEVAVYQSKNASPPATTDGYSLGHMQGTTSSFVNGSQAWLEMNNILRGVENAVSYIRPKTGWNQDSIVDFDLGGTYPVSLIKLGRGAQGSCWSKGSRLEVSSSLSGSFVPLWSTTGALNTTVSVAVPPSLQQIRRVRLISTGTVANGVNTDRLPFIEFFSPVSTQNPFLPMATIPNQAGQVLSAVVYDSTGRMVRTLESGRICAGQPIPLYWDGTDTFGAIMPPGSYHWRAVLTNGAGQNIASVGDSGNPPHGATEALGGATGLTYDSSGNLYQCTWWVERHLEVRKTSAAGQVLWNQSLVGSTALAADSTHTFVATSPYGNGEDRVYRLNSGNGTFAPFSNGSNYIVVNSGRPTGLPPATNLVDVQYGFEALNGLAVDSQRLFVSNYFKNEVEVFDRATGAKLAGLPVTKPLGLAVRSSGTGGELWVASDSQVKSFTYTASPLAFTARPAANIASGNRPQALSLSTGNQLAVGDVVEGKVKIYNIAANGTATFVRQIGQLASPGAVGDGHFRPLNRFSVAMNPAGHVTVGDPGNRMLWYYDSSGTLTATNFSEFQPQPLAFNIVGETHRLLSGPWEYEVDLSGTPHAGPRWYDNGLWKLSSNWMPSDRLFYSYAQAMRVTLANGRHYILFMAHSSGGVAFYEILSNGTLRRSFILGTRWKGLDESLPSQLALWSWRDLNGNGLMDWDPSQSGSGQEGSFVVAPGANNSPLAWELRSPGVWMDAAGNLWFARLGEAICKLSLLGFDSANNPIYDPAQIQTVVPKDTSAEAFRANNMKISSSGDLFALGFSNYTGSDPYLWMGGKEIRRYSPTGTQLSKFTVPDRKTIVSFAFDPVEDGLFYTADNQGGNPVIRVWNPEGLCLASAAPDPVLTGDMGWVDGFMGLSSFTPDAVRRLIYAEDVWNGKSALFEFVDLEEVARYRGAITLSH